MLLYNYVGTPNLNLTSPFVDPVTTTTCFHTFCRECIERALHHSSACPIDRTPLQESNIQAASPIVRALVDELDVVCVHKDEGCAHVCQRQRLAAHLEECQFRATTLGVASSTSRTDLSGFDISTDDVAESIPSSSVSCTQSVNGCKWQGPSTSLSRHLVSCPYEAIRGFFSLNEARIAGLVETNILLHRKVESLEQTLQTMKHEITALRTALGPWYRPIASSTERPSSRRQPSSPSIPFGELSRFYDTGGIPNDTDPLIPFFPPEDDVMSHPDSQTGRHTSIAPINLSTSLECSLSGLRESMVTLSASVESLGRRNEIALTNETRRLDGEARRLNEEIMSLRAALHGMRMQMHLMMVDRNSQITERGGDAMPMEPGWLPPPRLYHPQMHPPPTPNGPMMPPNPHGTKL
ncbi:hypothetical protein FISHEDRAFT_65545 [Fistulina hepatica ATCC 64428]|uniref:RING-type domain-containing protein n=1 Tax=Fistulina hepatica ATCC 64428 TaxID=1128425 RepID=A0A0D7ADM6_9AGAR|nr:hypothetical protein FISHEDRAFT_65545 [Fistulina hepatica ATCC 64428]